MIKVKLFFRHDLSQLKIVEFKTFSIELIQRPKIRNPNYRCEMIRQKENDEGEDDFDERQIEKIGRRTYSHDH